MNIPTIPVPPAVRFALYVAYAVGSAVATYLGAKGLAGEEELALWTALGVILTGLAASNVTEPYQGRHRAEAGRTDVAYLLVVAILAVILVAIVASLL